MYTIYEHVFRWLNESKDKKHIYTKNQIETIKISGTRRGLGKLTLTRYLEAKYDTREQRDDQHM